MSVDWYCVGANSVCCFIDDHVCLAVSLISLIESESGSAWSVYVSLVAVFEYV